MKSSAFLVMFALIKGLAFCQVIDEDLTEKFKAQRYYYLSLLELGHKLFKEEEYPKAIEYLVSAVKHSQQYGPKDYKPYEELGEVYSRQGRGDDSAWAYSQAIKILDLHFKGVDSDLIRQRLSRKIGYAELELIMPPIEFPELRAKAEEEFKSKKREIMIKVRHKQAIRELHYAVMEIGEITTREVVDTYQTQPKPSLRVRSRHQAFIELLLSYQQIIQLSTLEIFSTFQTEPKQLKEQ